MQAVLWALRHFREREDGQDAVIGVLHRWRLPLEELVPYIPNSRRLYKGTNDFVSPGVVLSTIHGAKGLEFDHVIVSGVDEGVLPEEHGADAVWDPDGEVHIARRLLFVAMTRARQGLILIVGPRPSRFVGELDPAYYQEIRVRAH